MPAPAPATKSKPAAPRRRKRRKSILAKLFCTLIFSCAVTLIIMSILQGLTTSNVMVDSVEKMVQEVDLTKIPASQVIPNAQSDTSMAGWIADVIEDSYTTEVSVDEADVQAFLEDSTILPFIAQKVGGYFDDFRNDTSESVISKEELEDILWENQDQIEDLVGTQLTQQDVEKVVEQVSANGALESITPQTIKQEIPAVYTVAQFSLSEDLLKGLTLAILVLTALVLLCYRFNLLQTLGSVGLALALAGGIFVALIYGVQALNKEYDHLLLYMANSVLQSSTKLPMYLLIGGAAFFVFDKIVLLFTRRK